MMKIGSLFAGVGGLELGLERAGVGHTVWQVELDDFCRSVLTKHWPNVERHADVRAVGSQNLSPVGVICGGFPCVDISFAGLGAGLAGERSGLWWEFARIVRELRPRFVVVENVAALLVRGVDDVLGTLASLGYDAEWSCVRACDVGAPHRRDRLFIVAQLADADGERREFERLAEHGSEQGASGGEPDGCGERRRWHGSCGGGLGDERAAYARAQPGLGRSAPGFSGGLDGTRWPARPGEEQHPWEPPRTLARPHGGGRHAPVSPEWLHRRERLHALGNSVSPAVGEVVGRKLIEMARR